MTNLPQSVTPVPTSVPPSPASATPGPVASGQRAQGADAFVSSIGVVTHIAYPGGIYDSAVAVALLQGSGIRYYRDAPAPGPGNSSGNYQAPWTTYNSLASSGIHADFVWDSSNFSGDPSTWNPTPDALANGVSGIASFEGPNEKNAACTGNSSWVGPERAFMQALWTYSQAHASTLPIPILAPALGNCNGISRLYSDSVALGSLANVANVGNMHAYPGFTVVPEVGGLVDAQGGAPSYVDAARQVIPSGPLQISETGYGTDQVSNATQAKYDLRLLLNAWNQGIARTYLFALIDDSIDGASFEHFGLVDGTYAPKPAYNAVKNLIAVLADPGAAFAPGSLAYSLSGNTANVQATLLQKQNGLFYLILWIAEAAGGPSQSVQLNLANAATLSAQSFDANGKLTAVSLSKSGGAYSLSVTDTPTIITIQS